MNAFMKQKPPRRRGLAAFTAAMVVGSSLIASAPAALADDEIEATEIVETVEAPVTEEVAETESPESGEAPITPADEGDSIAAEGKAPAAPAAATPATAAASGPVAFAATPPGAGADAIIVNSLGTGGDASPGMPCEATAGAGDCTLRAALEIANASANTDGTNITFDPALAGTGKIELTGPVADSMYQTQVGNPAGNLAATIGTLGARFLVDSDYAVSIDFTNLDGIDGQDYAGAAGFYVVSDNVTLTNLADFRAAEAGIAVSGSDATISNIVMTDNLTDWMENGVVFLDGASGITVDSVTAESMFYYSFAVDTAATVTDIEILNSSSRGVHAWGHIGIEDNAIVNGFVVDSTKLGDNTAVGGTDEASPVHGFYMNPGIRVTDLEFTNSGFHSARHDAFFFEGSNQTLTNTVIVGNDFVGAGDQTAGIDARQIDRVISYNTATWDGLNFSNNDVTNAAATIFGGSLSNATFTNNAFTDVNDAGYAALQLGQVTDGVTVSNNSFDRIWAHDTIRVQGTSATDVIIEDNTLNNLIASVSRSAVRIDAAGTGNAVRNNTLFQDLSDGTLPGHADNHWAIYNSANAASATAEVGWEISENSIDGFGGRDRSQAPIVHNAIGKLPVWGNTFGTDTRGSASTDVEHSGYWFFWNVWDSRSNNTVQTYRADNVSFDGTDATFTAVQPANEPGNNAATNPVTVYVYWTAADHAEVYLGSIDDVNPGDVLTIPTTETDGFIRLQTQDANGNFSQYSSVDPDAPSTLPAEIEATDVTETTVAGTGEPGYFVRILDENGDPVLDENGDPVAATIDADGNWTVEGLECGTDYTAVQYSDDDAQASSETSRDDFTTADCPIDPVAPDAPKVTKVTKTSAAGSGEPDATVEVRDLDGNVVGTATVDADGNWTVTGLKCGTDYEAVQIVDGVESDAGAFTTLACATDGGDDDKKDDDKKDDGKKDDGKGSDLAKTGDSSMLLYGGIALLLLAAGATTIVVARRKTS